MSIAEIPDNCTISKSHNARNANIDLRLAHEDDWGHPITYLQVVPTTVHKK